MAGTPYKEMNMAMTIIAIVNGMIGGSILVIPLISLQAGWAQTILVILFTGIFSYYSCYLSIIHLGDQKDLDLALLRHFNGNKFLSFFYDICVWSGILLVEILYFELIVIQWQGLVPPYTATTINPIINGVVLIAWCICLKFFQFGAYIMGYGIVSIGGYLLFLIWVISAAPTGNNTVPAFGSGLATFAALMGNAFSIQGFFIPVMKCYKAQKKHNFVLLLAFLIGGLAYYYIAYMGSFGIVNRTNYTNSQTIEGFFRTDQWEVKLLQGIYLVHLYSVFPQYLLVSKKRFFNMIGVEESKQRKINLGELIYIVIAVGLCLSIAMLNVNIDVIIGINGAVLGFCFVYLLPSLLHIKCLYFAKGKRKMPQITHGEQLLLTTNKDKYNFELQLTEANAQKQETNNNKNVGVVYGELVVGDQSSDKRQQKIDYSYFYCGYEKKGLKQQIVDMAMMGIMFCMGLFIMVNGLIEVVQTIKGE